MRSNIIFLIFIILLAASIYSAELCGDRICTVTENKDNCPSDCGLRNSSRNIGDIYTPKEVMIQQLKNLSVLYPDLVSYESIGKTLGGKDIWLFKIGNPDGGRVMFDGELHGTEDCGTETGYKFVRWVIESKDPDAVRIRENNYLLFLPIINADTLRRQNSRTNYTFANGTVVKVLYGVDLNRNFVRDWGKDGSKNISSTFDYIGYSPGSEPETKAVRNAIAKFRPNVYMNVHCGMETLKYYSNTSLERDILDRIAKISKNKGVNVTSAYNPFLRDKTDGGYLYSDAASYGASAWLFEISTWENMPKTLDGYHKRWYNLSFPIYAAMCNAVEKPRYLLFMNFSNTKFNGSRMINVQGNNLTSKNGFTFETKVKINTIKQSYIANKEKNWLLQARAHPNSKRYIFQGGLYKKGVYMPIINSSLTPKANSTYHLVLTYDSNAKTLCLYINKKLDTKKTVNFVPDISASQLYIGNRPGLDRGLVGDIYYVKYYNKTLSAEEIQKLS